MTSVYMSPLLPKDPSILVQMSSVPCCKEPAPGREQALGGRKEGEAVVMTTLITYAAQTLQ